MAFKRPGSGVSRRSELPPPGLRRRSELPPPGSGLVDHEAADVATVEHVAVALVEVLEAVPGGDELVQLELPGPVQLEQPRDRVERVAAAEQRALDPLLEQGELEPRQLDGPLVRAGQP